MRFARGYGRNTILAFAMFLPATLALAAPLWLKVSGQNLVDPKGHATLLRGVGLGNWLLPEGYMWQIWSKSGDRPRHIEALVSELLGADSAAKFWKAWRMGYITQADIQRMAALGFNCVRLPLNARQLMPEDGPVSFNAEAFADIDRLIAWCRSTGIWVILDLHAAPGGQTGANIDDSVGDHPNLFKIHENQDRCDALWRELAKRYKDEPTVAAFDLLNEPLPGHFNQYNSQIDAFYRRLIRSIREIDTRHIISLEGVNWSTDFSVFGPPSDPNLLYQFHKYWDVPDAESLKSFLTYANRYKVPLFAGETGETRVGTHWYRAVAQLFEEHNIGWAFWPWKRMGGPTCPYIVQPPAGWDKVMAYSEGKAKPSRAEAQAAFDGLLANVALDRCEYQPEVIADLFRRLPGRVEAEDFGSLGQGQSFKVNNPGARAQEYRKNEAVAISASGSNLNVGWMEQGEWLDYPVEVDAAGLYRSSFRMAAQGGGAHFHLSVDGITLGGSVDVPATGAWERYKIFDGPALQISAGKHHLRFVCDTGGHNLDWLAFRKEGSASVPASASGHVPGLIQAEDFGPGGEGVSYHDNDAANQGKAGRTSEGVDLQVLSESFAVDLKAGESLRYKVEVQAAQKLTPRLRIKGSAGSAMTLRMDNKVVMQAAGQGEWHDVPGAPLAFSAGSHTMDVVVSNGNLSLDWVEWR